MHTDYNTNGIPIRAGGQIVGRVTEDRFIKRVRGSKHMLREPKGWAIDVQSLANAEYVGASLVQIVDSETGTIYEASMQHILTKGFRFNRGFGSQICLPLERWTINRPGEPQQLVLALGGIG